MKSSKKEINFPRLLLRMFFRTVIICLLAIIGTLFIFYPRRITGNSMDPTLVENSLYLFDGTRYLFHDIERGDIINFHNHEVNVGMVKRVIGIEGDEIHFQDGYVIINGQRLEEDYLPEETVTYCSKTFIVPEGHVFVMGDNRLGSADSRMFEQPYISEKDIHGKLIGAFVPEFSGIKSLLGCYVYGSCFCIIISNLLSYPFLIKDRRQLLQYKELLMKEQELNGTTV